MATDHEISHGRNITWPLRAKEAPDHITEAMVGTRDGRDGRSFRATHLFLTNLRTTPEALLQLERDRWSIEGWHWITGTQLHEDAHRCRGNGTGAMATLRTVVMSLLRLAGCESIRAGMQAMMG